MVYAHRSFCAGVVHGTETFLLTARLTCTGVDEELFEFAVGVGVGGELEGLGWVDDLKLSEGHSASQFGIGLAEG